MASHPPAIIGPACSPVSKAELNGSMSAQLRCTHEALFEALGTIDLTSDVIILTADHGYALGDDDALGHVGQIVHIRGGKGPRLDPTLATEEVYAASNLILLCANHHQAIDVGNPEAFPVEALIEMKAQCGESRLGSSDRSRIAGRGGF